MAKKKKSKKEHIKHEAFRDRNISSLDSHPRQGKILQNPYSIISPTMTPRSWVNECIPNILWACILATSLERSHYLRLFRTVAITIRESISDHDKLFITHNYLSHLSETEFNNAFEKVLSDELAAKALSALLLVEALPDKNHWQAKLTPPDDSHWNVLGNAVAGCFDHQSQRATDIRWLKVMFLIITGRMHFPSEMSDMLENFRLYPDRGDMRSVRPSIRAIEISTRMMEFAEEKGVETRRALPAAHQSAFWEEMHNRTQCIMSEQVPPKRAENSTIHLLLEAAKEVAEHFHATIEHTGLDAKHDSSFGLVLYAIHLLTESAASYAHSSAPGRSTLRTIVECFITLAYLTKKDDPSLWLKHRDHGNGQTKLSLLKNLSADSVPRFIDLELLESLANEDKWLEFHDINLGAWAGDNLRVMAIEADLKDIYDSYYDICSGYSHGHWTAVRDTAFVTCSNPLHRFHRIPAPINFGMRSIINDGIDLLNRMLAELAKLYPGLEYRIAPNREASKETDNNSDSADVPAAKPDVP